MRKRLWEWIQRTYRVHKLARILRRLHAEGKKQGWNP